MIKNYLKTALRNLFRQKGISFINIFGLSVGLACFILFLLYAVNEFSFDRFHKNGNSIYRVYLWSNGIGDRFAGGDTYMPMPLGPAFKEELPGVENFIRFRDQWGENFIKNDNQVFREGVSFADPQFFSVFSFKLKSGNAATALQSLNSIVLTEEAAHKIFGDENPFGKTIEIKIENKFEPFTVSAIAENIPANSSIQFKILGNFNYLATIPSGLNNVTNWHRSAYQTYVQFKPGAVLPGKTKMIELRKKYYPDEESNLKEKGWKGTGYPIWYGFQPIRDMHTNMKIDGGTVQAINPQTIWILISIAAGVLLIACINFTTLSIGRSAGRAKEIGVRKVIGGDRKSLMFQFLAEALLLTILSATFGLLLVKLLLPFFNGLSGRELEFSLTRYPEMIWLIVALLIIATLLAGSYPALVLSGFKPIEVLKTKVKLSGANLFTKSLVTVQFVLSAGLIISTIIILQQLHYMQSKNPGFNKENVIVVEADGTDTRKIYPLFKQELSAQPEVLGVASAEIGLGEGSGWSMSGFDYNGKHKQVFEYFIDNDYLKVLGLQLIAGRNFDPAISSDTTNSVIINEAMAKDFGWTIKDAIGQRLSGYSDQMTPIVIGVVKDFNFRPFSEKVQPQLFHQFSSYQPYKFFIRIKSGNPSEALSKIQAAWKKIVPDYPLKYSFLDENLNRFYKSEARWSNIVGWAGGISIFLACLGLLGLTMLTIVNRTKEIGIRKVLGASVSAIASLLSKDYLKLVFIALLIAGPLAWYFMNKWLENFAYRISINWFVFLIAGLSSLVIAFLTISFQAVKAAIANPVKSLRTE